MNEKYEKYLPLGSIVLLNNANKRIMIIGYCIKSAEATKDNKIWDYIGCLYPEGVLSSDKNLVFEHKDIKSIYALGYSDDEHRRYISYLKEKMNKNIVGEKI